MKHKHFKFLFTFVLCSCMLLLTTPIYAATSYNSYLDKPQVDGASGYIVILLKNKSTSAKSIQVIQWFTNSNTNADAITNEPYVNVLVASNKLTLTVYAESQSNVSLIWWKGESYQVDTGTAKSTSTYSRSYSYSSYDIVGYKIEGNVGILTDQLSGAEVFEVNWSNNPDTSKLSNILQELNEQGVVLDSISGNISTIKNTLNTLKSSLSTNNNILTNIYNYLQTSLSNIIDLITGNDSASSSVSNNDNVNSEFQDVNNQYDVLEQGFQNNMNTSLDSIDTNINLIGFTDFISTATFISTNITRIIQSNEYYESFVFMGLILGLALFLIGKRVI